MLTVSSALADTLAGSYRPVLVVDAYYDGDLIMADVPVTSGTVVADGARNICRSVAFTAASEDGVIAPDGFDSPLAPYGSEVQVRVGADLPRGGRDLVSLGWFRLDTSDPSPEMVRRRLRNGSYTWIPQGVRVSCAGSDRFAGLDDARMLSAEQPASTGSAITELIRLARDVVPIGDWSAVTDKAIPTSLTYGESRVDAVQALAELVGVKARMSADGVMVPMPLDAAAVPVATIHADLDAVSWSRRLDRHDVYNAVVAKGEAAPDRVQPQGVAIETSGPLRYDGPFGRVPYGYGSPVLGTDAEARAAANTVLARLGSNRVTDVNVVALANPALEPGDVIAVEIPWKDGMTRTLTGPIVRIEWPLPLSMMTVTVAVPRTQLWGV